MNWIFYCTWLDMTEIFGLRCGFNGSCICLKLHPHASGFHFQENWKFLMACETMGRWAGCHNQTDVQEGLLRICVPILSQFQVEKTVWDWELLNDIKPIWQRPTKEIEEDEYTAFYKTFSKVTLKYFHKYFCVLYLQPQLGQILGVSSISVF